MREAKFKLRVVARDPVRTRVVVYAGPPGTPGMAGTLVFRNDEWEALADALACLYPRVEVEPTPLDELDEPRAPLPWDEDEEAA